MIQDINRVEHLHIGFSNTFNGEGAYIDPEEEVFGTVTIIQETHSILVGEPVVSYVVSYADMPQRHKNILENSNGKFAFNFQNSTDLFSKTIKPSRRGSSKHALITFVEKETETMYVVSAGPYEHSAQFNSYPLYGLLLVYMSSRSKKLPSNELDTLLAIIQNNPIKTIDDIISIIDVVYL